MLRSFKSTQLLRKSLFASSVRNLSYPAHLVVNMPSLSPTMESGSVAKWNLKEGDRFEPGTSLCDVETDKATVSFDATEEGYIAKILIASGDIKVGQPLLVTVEEAGDVAAFANFKLENNNNKTVAAPAVSTSAPATPAAISTTTPTATASTAPSTPSTGRIFASPLAKKLVKEAGEELSNVVLRMSPQGRGTGPNGRVVAADVIEALKQPRAASAVAASAPVATATTTPVAAPVKTNNNNTINMNNTVNSGVFEDFVVSAAHQQLAARLQQSKQTVPHYYLSVEMNLSNLLNLREKLNENYLNKKDAKKGETADENQGISVLDLLVKASAHAMRTVPDVNAAWMESFVRQYKQVDINVVMSGALHSEECTTPILRDVGNLGISSIAEQLSSFENRLNTPNGKLTESETAEGTFSVHNLGMYGIKSATPILLPPQAAAVAFGSISDTVIPNTNVKNADDKLWMVAPVITCTMVCDHRVVDGAVSAQWLAALKNVVENPINLMM